jgi:UDP-3-O-[3-hydroxymyristoyl] glucosamine N-acyltransferase
MKAFTIQQVLDYLQKDGQTVEFVGDAETLIDKIANVRELEDNCISWIKKKSFLTEDVETALLKHKDVLIVAPFVIENANTIITDNPKRTFFSILNEFVACKRAVGIHPTATVETENIGKNVIIGANCYIGPDVIIGDNVTIHHNVVIECPCTIGEGSELFSGVVIGTEGFGYYYDEEHVPVHEQHYMGVRIGKHVDVGANTCIDRGLLSDTVIEDNVKVDNLCLIAHNAIVRKNVLITGFCGIAGSSEIGKDSYLGPGCSILNQIKVGEEAYIGASSLVIRNVKDGKKVFGVPAGVLKFD